jgi:hypothetical protein
MQRAIDVFHVCIYLRTCQLVTGRPKTSWTAKKNLPGGQRRVRAVKAFLAVLGSPAGRVLQHLNSLNWLSDTRAIKL